MGLLFKVSSSSTACTFTPFFAVRLSCLVLTLCNLEQYEVDTILSVWFSQDSARYCWVLLSVILFANQNFLDDFSIGCSVSFFAQRLCLSTHHCLNWRDSVWEKSGFNLSQFKISICIWWRFVWVRTFEITEWIVCSVFFWNQLWLILMSTGNCRKYFQEK